MSTELIDDLSKSATERGRARILFHRDRDDLLQQMAIALRGGAYVRPHLNDRGFKAWHALRGRLLFATFEDDGRLRESVELGPEGPVLAVRLLERVYHTIIPLDDVAVYVETCAGPFIKTTYADWAPVEADAQAGAAWLDQLLIEVRPADA